MEWISRRCAKFAVYVLRRSPDFTKVLALVATCQHMYPVWEAHFVDDVCPAAQRGILEACRELIAVRISIHVTNKRFLCVSGE
jgi:hypothetical protein